MVIGELLALGEIALLHGQPRDGKTWCSLQIAVSIALGSGAAFGLPRFSVDQPRRVLIISNEDSTSIYSDRTASICAGHSAEAPDGIYFLVGVGVWFDDPEWQAFVITEIRQQRVDVVIVDPARSVTSAVDQGPRELQPFARFLRRLVTETGVAVLLVHHDTKPLAGVTDTRRRAQRSSGGGLFSIVDAPIHVERLDETRSLVTPDGFKHRRDPDPFVVQRQSGDGWVRLVGESTTATAATDVALSAAITEHLRTFGGGSGRAIATAVRRRRDDVNRVLEQLCEAGVVDVAEGQSGRSSGVSDEWPSGSQWLRTLARP